MTMKTILILGCGWVGEEFAMAMLDKGFSVYASTTSQEKCTRLKDMGIKSFVHDFDLNSEPIASLPTNFDYVLTSIPATSKLSLDQINYRFANIQSFFNIISFTKHIYLSSIGVYPNIDGYFTEDYELVANERLHGAEIMMLELEKTSVYRLGGLFGKKRIFAKYFENRVCTTGDQLANFIHLDDVIALIYNGFLRDIQFPIYNIVAPEHPTKKEVILASAIKYGFYLPSAWEPEDSFQKRVDGAKIIEELNYCFSYPNPINF